jgi:FxsC-like protein
MDASGISTGANWKDTLGGKLATAPVLVPVFSPRYFTREECGREIQVFLERKRLFSNSNPGLQMPACIIPVIWEWENLTIHPTLSGIHYGNANYPPKYETRRYGLRSLADLGKNRDDFKTFTDALGSVINQSLNGGVLLPAIAIDYQGMPNAFASPNPSGAVSGTRSVRFAYVAPSPAEVNAVRTNQTTYSATPRDWRAFDPACSTGIGMLSEAVAVELNLAHDTISIDGTWTSTVDAAQSVNGQVVFVVDSWAAKVPRYDPIFAALDQAKYHTCPVLVPLNDKDEENRGQRSQLLQALCSKLPSRVAAHAAFITDIADEVEYQHKLSRVLAARQSALINSANTPPSTITLPTI